MAQPNYNQRPSVPTLDNTTQQLPPLARNVSNVDHVTGNQVVPDDSQLQQPPSPAAQHLASTDNLTAQPVPQNDNKISADPVIDTKGVPASDTKDSEPLDSEALKKLSDKDLLEKGKKKLDEAKEAYTKYGRHKLANDAKEAIRPFIERADQSRSKLMAGMDWFRESSELVEALKQIELPPGTPKDLAITIQFPGEEVISLIPPGEALKNKNPTQVWEYFRLAFQAMHLQGQEYNNGNDNALSQAEAALNDVTAALKAIRKEIDERELMDNEGADKPKGSQLEVDYHEFTQKGVSFSRVAKGELLSYPFEAAGKVPDPTKKTAEGTPPASTDGSAATTDESATPVEGNTTAPAPNTVTPQSNGSAPAAAPGNNTQMPAQPA
ncbi:hypothetical protein GV64_04995 [Endozoicomonas elysicola]|uniref:Uncharacterized protein n=2 Tax=Endozoicomonas elysicola TaxID=305900 RepID=A0A081K7R0_9GAMM|nr:hypothetical protein GV64_04995 [Endozoicomonas elysicola]